MAIAALIMALVFTAVFLPAYTGEDGARGAVLRYFTIFFAIWAAGIWLTTSYTVLFFGGLFFSLALAAFAPSAVPFRRGRVGHRHKLRRWSRRMVAYLPPALLPTVAAGLG